MHTNSLPPTDRDESPDNSPVRVAPPLPPVKSKSFKCNDALRDKLRALHDSSPAYSNAQLGQKLGYSHTVLSLYLSKDGCKYNGNVAGLEKKIEDFLQALERRRASGIETNPSKVADDMLQGFEYIRKTCTLGVIVAESGEGKTRGIELIQKENPLAILIEATEWNRSAHDLMSSLWDACAVDGWDSSHGRRFPYLVQKMRGSERPIIIDDAHKLSREALSLITTFHEKTKCPIILIGCPEVVDKLASDPQRLSRTHICWTIKSDHDPKILLHMVRSIAKDVNGELDDLLELCQQSCNGHGHKRTVEQLLKGAAEFRHADHKLTWCDAYRQASQLSIVSEIRRRKLS